MEFNRNYYSYSMKNTPLPSEKLYKTIFIEKVKLSIKRMRWKAHLYENSGLNASNPLNYVLKAGYVHHSIKILCNFKTTC